MRALWSGAAKLGGLALVGVLALGACSSATATHKAPAHKTAPPAALACSTDIGYQFSAKQWIAQLDR